MSYSQTLDSVRRAFLKAHEGSARYPFRTDIEFPVEAFVAQMTTHRCTRDCDRAGGACRKANSVWDEMYRRFDVLWNQPEKWQGLK